MGPVSAENTFYGKFLRALGTGMIGAGAMLNGTAAGGDGAQQAVATSGCDVSRVL